MKRRDFLKLASLAGVAPVILPSLLAAEPQQLDLEQLADRSFPVPRASTQTDANFLMPLNRANGSGNLPYTFFFDETVPAGLQNYSVALLKNGFILRILQGYADFVDRHVNVVLRGDEGMLRCRMHLCCPGMSELTLPFPSFFEDRIAVEVRNYSSREAKVHLAISGYTA